MTDKNTVWTINALRSWTRDYFQKAGIDTPQLDADILLADTLGVERIQLLICGTQEVSPDDLAKFKQRLIRRAKNREPIAYILGTKEFWSLPLKVTPDTLIPRPDTECLVETVLNAIRSNEDAHLPNETPSRASSETNDANGELTYESMPDERMASYVEIWAEQDRSASLTDDEIAQQAAIPTVDENGDPIASRDIYDDIDDDAPSLPAQNDEPHDTATTDGHQLRILDVGTGTGAIILALASELGQQNDYHAVDISPNALAVAKQNAADLGFDNIHFVQSDLLDNVEGSFDVIVSNPPYVTESEYLTVEPEVKCEPKLALTAGTSGLDIYKRLIPMSFNRLKKAGILAVEIGFKQADEVKTLFENAHFKNVTVHPDYAGNPRIVIGWKNQSDL